MIELTRLTYLKQKTIKLLKVWVLSSCSDITENKLIPIIYRKNVMKNLFTLLSKIFYVYL